MLTKAKQFAYIWKKSKSSQELVLPRDLIASMYCSLLLFLLPTKVKKLITIMVVDKKLKM